MCTLVRVLQDTPHALVSVNPNEQPLRQGQQFYGLRFRDEEDVVLEMFRDEEDVRPVKNTRPTSAIQQVVWVRSEPGRPRPRFVLLSNIRILLLALPEPGFKTTPQSLQTEIWQSVFDGLLPRTD